MKSKCCDSEVKVGGEGMNRLILENRSRIGTVGSSENISILFYLT